MGRELVSKRDKRIKDAWTLAEETFGDEKSTEFMLAWTSDAAGVDCEHVVDWLAREHGSGEAP
jgi:hypothetical protein